MVHTFDKKAFKKQIKENVKLLYRKEFEEANDQEVYQALTTGWRPRRPWRKRIQRPYIICLWNS